VSFRCQGGALFTSGSGAANQTVSWTPGSGSWTFSSDRNLKDRFQSVDALAILEKVSHLPIMEWSYKEYPERHIGAIAQDFHALFPLNANDKVLNDADLHGVALAAIKGLNQKLELVTILILAPSTPRWKNGWLTWKNPSTGWWKRIWSLRNKARI
jgi:hypothetical protein